MLLISVLYEYPHRLPNPQITNNCRSSIITVKKLVFTLLVFLITAEMAIAGSVPMRDYNLLSTGMSEAEILYRLGPYDHETVTYGRFFTILRKTWYYIPTPEETSNFRWITEIQFDNQGLVTGLDRYRAH